jgi:hypothetical protein
MNFGGRIHWPTDLRSAADEWIGLLQTLDRLWSHWPLDIASAIRRARTYPEAIGGLRDLAATRAARSYLFFDAGGDGFEGVDGAEGKTQAVSSSSSGSGSGPISVT